MRDHTLQNMQRTMQRKTVNLDEGDWALLAPFLEADSREQTSLRDLVGDEDASSESSILRALILAGRRAVLDELLEQGYAAWAAAWDEEDEAFAALAGRQLEVAWEDDE